MSSRGKAGCLRLGHQVLPDDELVLGQLPATCLRRLEAADQQLAVARILEDQLDRLDPVADPCRRRAAAPDELLELVAKRRRDAIDEPRDELAPFTRREPETRVRAG